MLLSQLVLRTTSKTFADPDKWIDDDISPYIRSSGISGKGTLDELRVFIFACTTTIIVVIFTTCGTAKHK